MLTGPLAYRRPILKDILLVFQPAPVGSLFPSLPLYLRQPEMDREVATSSYLSSLIAIFFLWFLGCLIEPFFVSGTPPTDDGLCALMVRPMGYPCTEYTKDRLIISPSTTLKKPYLSFDGVNIDFYVMTQPIIGGVLYYRYYRGRRQEIDAMTVQTEDGYLLTVQRIPHGKSALREHNGPVFLQHGLFQGGDTWFLNPVNESLGFILADYGFDVWVGNVRGTRWSRKHITLSEHDRAYWDWSWQDLAQYDLAAMLGYIQNETSSKVLYIGHSQGTIMALSAFTMPDIVKMVEAAAFLCPISYLEHISSTFALRAVSMHIDEMLLSLGVHQLNFRSSIGVHILDSLCDGHMDCGNLLQAITGKNCCFNASRVDYYLKYEPHASSTKNLHHLFQMIRKGTFAKYDFGWWGNLKHYQRLHPPAFNLGYIPESLPLWIGYGGNDALADLTDLKRTINELKSKPELCYIESYGHIDFILSVNAKNDVYSDLIRFLRSREGSSSS